jgi:hypothetical protein
MDDSQHQSNTKLNINYKGVHLHQLLEYTDTVVENFLLYESSQH